MASGDVAMCVDRSYNAQNDHFAFNNSVPKQPPSSLHMQPGRSDIPNHNKENIIPPVRYPSGSYALYIFDSEELFTYHLVEVVNQASHTYPTDEVIQRVPLSHVLNGHHVSSAQGFVPQMGSIQSTGFYNGYSNGSPNMLSYQNYPNHTWNRNHMGPDLGGFQASGVVEILEIFGTSSSSIGEIVKKESLSWNKWSQTLLALTRDVLPEQRRRTGAQLFAEQPRSRHHSHHLDLLQAREKEVGARVQLCEWGLGVQQADETKAPSVEQLSSDPQRLNE
ncbi:LOW QUALITY PROTEIN: hypothetical protein CVT26_001134 [Gymnopilus dilepis]|uniref:Uncharacterized protein n=1 Tax=Gymnopilus dilepis TaxID=231916 RepID=A0A409WBJ1_9AGAR|nr:LOW QUALITY PROTEIN: hypothetical protein CVT26_001134 [Gymnopilus dilepis]